MSAARQNWDWNADGVNDNIIWISSRTPGLGGNGVSFTSNDGITWYTTLHDILVYNIVAVDSLVFAASENGLWKSSHR